MSPLGEACAPWRLCGGALRQPAGFGVPAQPRPSSLGPAPKTPASGCTCTPAATGATVCWGRGGRVPQLGQPSSLSQKMELGPGHWPVPAGDLTSGRDMGAQATARAALSAMWVASQRGRSTVGRGNTQLPRGSQAARRPASQGPSSLLHRRATLSPRAHFCYLHPKKIIMVPLINEGTH